MAAGFARRCQGLDFQIVEEGPQATAAIGVCPKASFCVEVFERLDCMEHSLSVSPIDDDADYRTRCYVHTIHEDPRQ